jgi:putative transposase
MGNLRVSRCIHGLTQMNLSPLADAKAPIERDSRGRNLNRLLLNPMAYLIRLSTYEQQPLLGHFGNGQFCINEYGTIVADEWVRCAENRKGIELDLWILLPDGLQGIVLLQPASIISSSRGLADSIPNQKPWVLSSFIASFKAAAAKRINLRRNQLGEPVWQRNYHEQMIRDDALLEQWRTLLNCRAS